MKFLQNHQFTLVSFFLLTLVIILNLQIPMKYKLTLILLGVILCFYQPKFIIPFLTSIIVVYLSNRNISKLKKNKNKNKKVKEGFFDTKSDFIDKMGTVTNFNYADLISNTDISDLRSQKIKITPNDKDKVLKTNFLINCFQMYFFEFPTDFTLALRLNLLYPKIADLKKEFNFTDISSEVGYDDDAFRQNIVPLLKNKTLIKLGLLVHQTPFLNIKRYFLKVISDFGLYSVLNKKYVLETDTDTDKETNFEDMKKNIYEICILVFYFTYREKDGTFDFNQSLELDELSLFNLVPQYLQNKTLEEPDINYNILEKKIKAINMPLLKEKKLFPEPEMLQKILGDDSFTEDIDETLDINSSINRLEETLDLFFKELDNYLDDLKLLDISLYRVSNKEQQRKQEYKIKGNYFILLLMTGYCDELFNLLVTKSPNKSGKNVKSTLSKNNEALYNKKKNRFQLQVQNEITINQPYNFTSIQDIFYDIFYFYFGVYTKKPKIYTRSFIYPEVKEISSFPSVSPAPSTDSINPLSEYQQQNFELDLDPYLDESSLRQKQEEALNKYYQFLDKENYEKVQGLNKLAENRNQELKIKELSFNNIIDNFGKEVFQIIDELVLVSKKFYYNQDIAELQSQTNQNIFNPTFQENFNSPTPSSSNYKNLSNFDKYILFIKVILDILLRENRIIYTGFIFIMLALLIYFIDSGNSAPPASPGINSIFDLLKL